MAAMSWICFVTLLLVGNFQDIHGMDLTIPDTESPAPNTGIEDLRNQIEEERTKGNDLQTQVSYVHET